MGLEPIRRFFGGGEAVGGWLCFRGGVNPMRCLFWGWLGLERVCAEGCASCWI